MYIERRKSGKNTKYYLIHSYREKNRVEKIRKYLGMNLSEEELRDKEKKAERVILKVIQEMSTRVFWFSLTKKQKEILNRYNNKIKIFHLNKEEWKLFTEDFVYNTNAIEGSTVSEEEVKEILSEKPETRDPEEIETLGVAKAVDYIRTTKEDLSLDLLLKLHRLCFERTKPFAGKFRDVNVVVRDSRGNIVHAGAPKEEMMYHLKNFVSWYKENKDNFKPLVLAAILHDQFELIHPFQDGNGRVGRLLLNYILIKNGYPPINISLKDRMEYYWTLQKYSRENDLKPTLKFLVKQYKKTLKEVTTKNKPR